MLDTTLFPTSSDTQATNTSNGTVIFTYLKLNKLSTYSSALKVIWRNYDVDLDIEQNIDKLG